MLSDQTLWDVLLVSNLLGDYILSVLKACFWLIKKSLVNRFVGILEYWLKNIQIYILDKNVESESQLSTLEIVISCKGFVKCGFKVHERTEVYIPHINLPSTSLLLTLHPSFPVLFLASSLALDRFQSPAVSVNNTVTQLTRLISSALSLHPTTAPCTSARHVPCWNLSLWRRKRWRKK